MSVYDKTPGPEGEVQYGNTSDYEVNVLQLPPPVPPTTTISVTNTFDSINGDTSSLAALIDNDGGDGISLREAIDAANNQAGADTINFNIAAQASTRSISRHR